MLPKLFLLALAITPLVSAHGKVTVVTGNAGGNGTALAIRGGVVPGTGPNSKTEVDTTVFSKTSILTDGLGKTTGSGKNTVSMIVDAMALSGTTLPQITAGGNITGTFHIVTADGAGPIQAVLDPTATGRFSAGVPLTVVEQIPGEKGNFVETGKKKGQRSWLWARAMDGLGTVGRRNAANVNKSFQFAFSVPAGTTCNGTVASMTGVCLIKIANSNKAGPFGGVVPVQIAAAAAAGGGNGAAGQAAACGRAFRG
ncbi:hypothetical protein VTI74DRAFT_10770 [Chaetomium olivicolor]